MSKVLYTKCQFCKIPIQPCLTGGRSTKFCGNVCRCRFHLKARQAARKQQLREQAHA